MFLHHYLYYAAKIYETPIWLGCQHDLSNLLLTTTIVIVSVASWRLCNCLLLQLRYSTTYSKHLSWGFLTHSMRNAPINLIKLPEVRVKDKRRDYTFLLPKLG